MARSEADIANQALSNIGVTKAITSLEDSSLEAQQCAIWYPQVRDKLLRRGPWPFATSRVQLAVVAGVTRDDWEYVYAAPNPCLAIHFVTLPGIRNPRPDQRIPHRVEARTDDDGKVIGKLILCDQEDAELCYTVPVEDPEVFDEDFADALAWGLAARLARSLKKDLSLANDCLKQAEIETRTALAAAGNEGISDPEPISSFESSRF